MPSDWMPAAISFPASRSNIVQIYSTEIVHSVVNVPLLWAAAMTHGYSSDRWLTYKQAADNGGKIRKGEKRVTGIFFKIIERELRDEGDNTNEIESVRVIWLFNLDQIDGINKP